MKTNRILSLRIIGGFLDGLNLMFDTGLTCIIGARGTGKSTILELIRFCLDQLPKKDLSAAARKRVDNLIANNLNGGRVELDVETADGLRYTITRAVGEEPIVLDHVGSPTAIKVASGSFFRAEIFSQNEVENIADQKRFQLDLIDSFAPSEVWEKDCRIEEMQESIVATARQTEPIRQKLQVLQEDLKQLPAIDEKLKAFSAGTDDPSGQVNKAHEAKALRDRETRATRLAAEALERFQSDLGGLHGRLKSDLTGIFSKEMLAGANGTLMDEMVERIRKGRSQIDDELEQALLVLDTCLKEHGLLGTRLNEAHAAQELEFRKVVEKHTQFQQQSAERAKLDRRRNELMDAKRIEQEALGEIEKLQQRQADLLRQLSELREERFRIRKGIADRLNHDLQPTIRVTLVQDGDSESYRELLEEHLKPMNMRHGVVAQRLVQMVPPAQLASLVRSADTTGLIEHGDLNADQAAKVIQAFNQPVRLAELESVELRDQPTIELQNGSGYKDSSTLSTGQKCTTILPILLLDSANPLLIDQPEDNLDNRFIFQTVVSKIEQVRQGRQLVFITHNPNIPVLGDAGGVVVMESNGDHGGIAKTGNVDVCRDQIITLLEGGAEAFSRRGDRYKVNRK
jgi:ABC-type lipoprotein export system ATPase subunit